MPRPGPSRFGLVRTFALGFALTLPVPSTRSETSANPAPATWWAIQPLQRPTPPPTPPHSSAIDAFAARLAASSPGAPAEADRRTLLRRLMVDLHGVLPTPEEVESFVHDPRPDAFEHEVDRLLASPRYGERWTRHWLDVVHFAESHGHDQDRPRENAWPYRDYLVDAFNHDTPYPRFVQEQIAADALFPEEPALIPALGFLAAGPWDESSLRDIREDTLDREIGRYLDRDDIVANVMTTFTSVTVHCARCHDHKFDPISQRDYYALQAVFAGTEKAERLYDLDPELNRRRQYWMRLQTALDRGNDDQVEALLTPALRTEQAAWESSAARPTVDWRVLEPAAPPTAFDLRFEPRPDGSFLAVGEGPPTNVYTFTASSPLPRVTALRLEVLPDPTLPAQGPGRAENGNLHLTDLRVYAATGGPTPEERAVRLAQPSADFDQEGWEIAKAIDSDPQTGWGLHPREGQAHTAVVEIAEPGALPAHARLRIVLHQAHGRRHTIGRFRLSATDAAPPIRASPIPPDVAAALAVAPEARAATQRLAVTTFFLAGRAMRELSTLPPPRRVYAGASVFPANGGQKPVVTPRTVRVLRRGEITKPLEEAAPGALTCVSNLPSRFAMADGSGTRSESLPDESLRRAALARWLTDRDNPLVWRSIVNRVWSDHFGRGIVETPNDFGHMGAAPVAPELLDWLAVTFRDDLGGSLKALHRLILTSRTWRQVAADPQSAGPLQPLRRRLDAETFRDSALRLAGRLDSTMGGPSVKQFAMSDGIHVTPNVDYGAFDPDAPGAARRSIYRFLFRTLPDPLMDSLDCPAGDQSQPVRGESFTALQAFALLNHPFVTRLAEQFARRASEGAPNLSARVERACALAWLRPPSAEELARFTDHARRFGMPHLCRALLNSNEFHFVD